MGKGPMTLRELKKLLLEEAMDKLGGNPLDDSDNALPWSPDHHVSLTLTVEEVRRVAAGLDAAIATAGGNSR